MKTVREENLKVICFLFIISTAIAQYCLQTGSGNGLPNFEDYGNQTGRITQHHQAIIPSYKFNCCGQITEWGVDVHRGNSNGEYELNLQVWRPSPTVKDGTGTGYYSLVGNNRFSSISLSSGVARLPLISQTPISFQRGDVLGFHVEDTRRKSDGIVVLNRDSELVWHAEVDKHVLPSTYSVGSSGLLDTSTHAAPVLSIATTIYSCSTLLPEATTLPPPPNEDTDDTPPPQESPMATTTLHNDPQSNSTSKKPIVPTSTTSNENGSEVHGLPTETATSDETAANLIIVSIILIIVILTIAITSAVVVAVLLKACTAKKPAIPTTNNMAYGVTTYEESTDLNADFLNTTYYEYPEVYQSSMVYNEVYRTNRYSARNRVFQMESHDASETVSENITEAQPS